MAIAPDPRTPLQRSAAPRSTRDPGLDSDARGALGQPGAPLHVVGAWLFKALGDPVRVGVLHTLEDPAVDELSVRQLAARTGFDAEELGPHLAALRRHGAIDARRAGDDVVVRIAHPRIAELLGVARAFLHETAPRPAGRVGGPRPRD